MDNDNKLKNPMATKVLFVCNCNSYRSPMAESILKYLLRSNKDINENIWEVDSAAIADWNVGCLPDPRCIKILADHNLQSDHIARQITSDDFIKYDYIFGMDYSIISDLKDIEPENCTAKIQLLGNYNITGPIVIHDLCFEHSFRECFDLISKSCEGFINSYLEK